MPEYIQPRQTNTLAPTVGIIDPVARAHADSVNRMLDQVGGNIDPTDGERFIRLAEFKTLANTSIMEAFSPGAIGGANGEITKSPSAASVHRIIDNLTDAIRQSLLYQRLEVGLSPQELEGIRRNIDEAVDTARAGITEEAEIREEQSLALASAVNNIWAQIGGTSAVIDDGALASASPTAAQATKWESVVASVTDPNTGAINSASIKEELVSYANNANGKFSSIYSVRAQVSAGGQMIVGGFGLSASTSAGDIGGPGVPGPTIDFGVRADRFYIAATADTPSAASQIAQGSAIPFMALTTPQTVNGVVYQPGVYIKRAVIGEATVGLAQIDRASINSLSAITATIGLLRTAASGARTEIRDNVIKVFDAGGNLRVQIGDLSL